MHRPHLEEHALRLPLDSNAMHQAYTSLQMLGTTKVLVSVRVLNQRRRYLLVEVFLRRSRPSDSGVEGRPRYTDLFKLPKSPAMLLERGRRVVVCGGIFVLRIVRGCRVGRCILRGVQPGHEGCPCLCATHLLSAACAASSAHGYTLASDCTFPACARGHRQSRLQSLGICRGVASQRGAADHHASLTGAVGHGTT